VILAGEAGDPGGPAGVTAGLGEQDVPPNPAPARDVLRYWRITDHGLKKTFASFPGDRERRR